MRSSNDPLNAAETIRLLSRAVNEHFSEELLKKLHLKTNVEDQIVASALRRLVVIITGNPGDGKTHLIRHAQRDFPQDTIVETDANHLESSEIVEVISGAIRQRKPLVIAINEGILLQACHGVELRFPWAASITRRLLHPYSYDSKQGQDEQGDKSCVIYDLTHRNNLAADVVNGILDRVTGLAISEATPMSENAQRLREKDVRSRLCDLLDAVARTGFHATMRDILGFVAYLLCGGEDEAYSKPPKPYYLNAFEGGEGPIFSAIRDLDPVRVPSPFLDDRLFEDEDLPAEWLIEAPEELRSGRDLANFGRRKRRALFEHREGLKFLRSAQNEVQSKILLLRNLNQSPERVAIAMLNRFFDSSRFSSDALTLWVAHRYHARPVRYLASGCEISASEFQVRVPRLPSHLEAAFPQHYGDHVVLVHSDMQTRDGLVMDARLVSQLLEGDRISGLGVRHPEAYAKVAAFYNRLSRGTRSVVSPLVRILRSDTMQQIQVGVNVEKRSYFLPGDIS